MIITTQHHNQPLPTEIKVERFDMAINFYAIVNINNNPHLICYDYNPIWNSWYPFYDDINKTPIFKKSTSSTYKQLIDECNKLLNIDLENKVSLAKNRFKELVCNDEIKLDKLDNFIVYELKYSKSTKVYTLYKLFNYVITDIENLDGLLNPKALKCKTFNLRQQNFQNLISNAEYIIKQENLERFCIN